MTTLASLYRNNSWRLPPSRSEVHVQLHSFLTTVALSEEQDTYERVIAGKSNQRYSIGTVYHHLRVQGAFVLWTQTVWNKGGIPRHSFLAWLFVLNQCSTRDMIIGWRLQSSPLCLLCNVAAECKKHLFFYCSFSWRLWGSLAPCCGFTLNRPWDLVMAQLQGLSPRSPKGKIALLCWQECIYWTQSEQNAQLHRNVFHSVGVITRLLNRQIKDKILSFRSINPAVYSAMMQQWNRLLQRSPPLPSLLFLFPSPYLSMISMPLIIVISASKFLGLLKLGWLHNGFWFGFQM